MALDTSIFKDYDIRGTYPDQINGQVAHDIAQAIVRVFSPKRVAIVRDMRLSGEELRDGLVRGFKYAGVSVTDAGLGGTEMQYFIAGTMDFDLVLMISASHNPARYNGIKLVKKGPVAVTASSGLTDVRDSAVAHASVVKSASAPATVATIDVFPAWKRKILSLVDTKGLTALSVVADAGNGMAGKLVPIIFDSLPLRITPLFFELDGRFPNHEPNPLVESNNAQLAKTVLAKHADAGITFDGDADRVFFVDDRGRFISGTITTALLARYVLSKRPGSLILYNAICGRIVPQTVEKFGGKAQRVRVGHSYIKNYMRQTGAAFAGEHSGHYYWPQFFNAESGVLTALTLLSLLSSQNKPLSVLVDELSVYASSGEINFEVADIPSVVTSLTKQYTDAKATDEVDGTSVWYDDWWFNIRASKTEPLLRLNVEADSKQLLENKTRELIAKIEELGGKRK